MGISDDLSNLDHIADGAGWKDEYYIAKVPRGGTKKQETPIQARRFSYFLLQSLFIV